MGLILERQFFVTANRVEGALIQQFGCQSPKYQRRDRKFGDASGANTRQFLWNMSFPTLEPHYEMVRDMKQNGSSYHEIPLTLASIGVEKGASVANIKQMCQRYGLVNQTWGKTTTHQLEFAVEEAMQEVITVFTPLYRIINYGCSINPDSKLLLARFRVQTHHFSWFWMRYFFPHLHQSSRNAGGEKK